MWRRALTAFGVIQAFMPMLSRFVSSAEHSRQTATSLVFDAAIKKQPPLSLYSAVGIGTTLGTKCLSGDGVK
jgi:hypothetical protein